MPAFAAVDSRADLDAAVARIGLPAVLKTTRFGYDGKGQAVLRNAADVEAAWATLGGRPLILEGFRALRPRAVDPRRPWPHRRTRVLSTCRERPPGRHSACEHVANVGAAREPQDKAERIAAKALEASATSACWRSSCSRSVTSYS